MRARRALLVAYGLARASAQVRPDANTIACNHDFGNSSYNLSPLIVTTYYPVTDSRNNRDSLNFTYYFNVCRNVIDPIFLTAYPACQATTNTGYGTQNFEGSAVYQVANWIGVPTQDKCHKLSGNVTKSTPTWSLADPTNPSVGVVLSYTGGDTCDTQGLNRSLRLWVSCYNDQGSVPTNEVVLESKMCNYDIFISSAYGCPAECPLVPAPDGSGAVNLCARHGVCDFDAAKGRPRCFCNDGWAGVDCASPTQPPPTGLSAVGGVLLTVGLLLVATLGFLVYLWNRIRSLRLDPSAYSSLRGAPEGEQGAEGGAQ